jgi:GNAT superfamily N-acetyltransferase
VRTICGPHDTGSVIDGWLSVLHPPGYLPPIERGDMVVVEESGSIVGFGEAVPGVIVAVYVDPAAVTRGVGSAIMRHALDIARRGHHGPVRLQSTLNAARFHERFGFREVGRSAVRRGAVAVPVVLMERDDA